MKSELEDFVKDLHGFWMSKSEADPAENRELLNGYSEARTRLSNSKEGSREHVLFYELLEDTRTSCLCDAYGV